MMVCRHRWSVDGECDICGQLNHYCEVCHARPVVVLIPSFDKPNRFCHQCYDDHWKTKRDDKK